MEGDAGSRASSPDEWGSAVVSGDATKLAKLVLVWSGSKPERALSILKSCVSLLEKEVAFSAPASPLPLPPDPRGPSRNSCLNAISVALNETSDGKSWYTSTKELQLASLEFCITCRNYEMLHLKVDPYIPRRLLAAADAPRPHPKRLCGTRVPRLRARSVTWNLPTAAEWRSPIFAVMNADCLKIGRAFEGRLEAVALPQRLKKIDFGHSSRLNKPLDLVEWPGLLQSLVLGWRFNRPIEGVSWPASLKSFRFGRQFNQPIEEVAWPTSLLELEFGENFNHPIQRAKFPASLQQLTFGGAFDQSIEGVLWPDSLQRLVFGRFFNKPVDNVWWPASLQEVSFGICCGIRDNRITLYSCFNQRVDSSVWPASLRRLTLGGDFRQSLGGLGTWMPNLEVLRVLDWEYDSEFDDRVDSQNDNLLRGIEWPKGLRELTVLEDSSFDGVEIPSSVKVYRPDLFF